MRKYIRIIRNILWFKKVIKNPTILGRPSFNRLLNSRKDLSLTKVERGYLYRTIIRLREVYPYEVQDYSEAKDLYEDYFKLNRCINSLEELKQKFGEQGELYITRFRSESPVKGERWCEYFVNSGFGEDGYEERVYKVYNIDCRYVVVDFNIYVSESDLTAFKYSSEKEIKDFKRNEIRKASIQQKIKQKEEEIKELEKLIND